MGEGQGVVIFIAIIKTTDDLFVLLNQDRSVCGFRTVDAGLGSFEQKYESGHRRGYEASMSACINWMTMQPSIVTIEDPEEIRQWVDDADNLKSCSVSGIAGSFLGLKLDPTKAMPVWDGGVKPKLIGGAP